MGQGVEDFRGGILGLREFVDEHEEALAVDLMAVGRSIHEIGVTISWLELRAWIHHPRAGTALAQELAAIAAEEAKPEDERAVGTKPGSAIPIDELNSWLGWDEDEEVLSGG